MTGSQELEDETSVQSASNQLGTVHTEDQPGGGDQANWETHGPVTTDEVIPATTAETENTIVPRGHQESGEDQPMEEPSEKVKTNPEPSRVGGAKGEVSMNGDDNPGTANSMEDDLVIVDEPEPTYQKYDFGFESLKDLIKDANQQTVQYERDAKMFQARDCWDNMYAKAKETLLSNLRCPKCHNDPSSDRSTNPHAYNEAYHHLTDRIFELAKKQSPDTFEEADMQKARLDLLALEEIYLDGSSNAECNGLDRLRREINGMRSSFKQEASSMRESESGGQIDLSDHVYSPYQLSMEELQPLIDCINRGPQHPMHRKASLVLNERWSWMRANIQANWNLNMSCPECSTFGPPKHKYADGFDMAVYEQLAAAKVTPTELDQEELGKFKEKFLEAEVKYVEVNFDPEEGKCRGMAYLKKDIRLLQKSHEDALKAKQAGQSSGGEQW